MAIWIFLIIDDNDEEPGRLGRDDIKPERETDAKLVEGGRAGAGLGLGRLGALGLELKVLVVEICEDIGDTNGLIGRYELDFLFFGGV